MRQFSAPLMLTVALTLGLAGCASRPRAQLDLPVSEAAQELAREQLHRRTAFQVAAYAQAQRRAVKGDCPGARPREPFIIDSSDYYIERYLSAEMRTARAKMGVDHKARVVWVDSGATKNLKVGDVIAELNGRPVDPSDEAALIHVVRSARQDLKPGEPFRVTLEDGTKLSVQGPTACESGLWGQDVSAYPAYTYADLTPHLNLPANLFQQARTDEDLRWLANFSLYVTTSPAAQQRRTKAHIAGVSQAVVGWGLAIIPGMSFVANRSINRTVQFFTLDGIVPEAAMFASKEMAELGANPTLGVEMFARANAKKLDLGTLAMSDAEVEQVRAYARSLRAPNAAK